MIIGDDAGFADPSFAKTVADISQGVTEGEGLHAEQSRPEAVAGV